MGKAKILSVFFLATTAVIVASSVQAGENSRVKESRIERGKRLFRRAWKPREALCRPGDGLGPLHNHVSCAGCHRLGGVGGAGPRQDNVDLLTVVRPANAQSPIEVFVPVALRSNGNSASFSKSLSKTHAGFLQQGAPSSTIILHRHGLDRRYADFREGLIPGPWDPEVPVRRFTTDDGISFRLSQRNTPALFGAGLVDEVPIKIVKQLAIEQRKYPGVTGRIAPAAGKQFGRFGWRGQIGTLREFVLAACANELGLQVARNPQALDPLNSDYHMRRNDLERSDLRALVAYVRALPAPVRDRPRNASLARQVRRGEQLFHDVGCVACHVADLGHVTGIYSDLLLHDMGPWLSDPVPAAAESATVANSGYFGVVLSQVQTPSGVTKREWRTPPLWGVRDSAPYLHDGRAETLGDAIELHGGEAKFAREAFGKLSEEEQESVIAFLNCLVAPRATANER